MLRKALSGLAILGALSLGACTQPGDTLVELRLPEGDAMAGKQAFVDLGCTACHTVTGIEGLPAPEVPETSFELGPTLAALSRGGIATSVITPAHVNAEATELWTDWEPGQRVWLGPGQVAAEGEQQRPKRSRMSSYGDVMTINQLSDLVAFLDSAAGNQ